MLASFQRISAVLFGEAVVVRTELLSLHFGRATTRLAVKHRAALQVVAHERMVADALANSSVLFRARARVHARTGAWRNRGPTASGSRRSLFIRGGGVG